MKRHSISKRRSRKVFSKTATKTRSLNLRAASMRCGFAI